MVDREAQAEAWFRKKPKRIIQSQTLIVALIIGIIIAPPPLTMCIFWLVFQVSHALVIPSIVVVWVFSSAVYVVGRLYYRRNNC